jgi:hypothetical protein
MSNRLSPLTRLAALLCLALAAPAQAQPPAPPDEAETISIRVMPPGGFCAGLCPSFEASLDVQGMVRVEDLYSVATGPAQHLIYTAPARSAAAFRSLLRPLRPALQQEPMGWLGSRLAATNALEIVVTWRRGDRVVRYATARGDPDYALVRQALAAVDLDEYGRWTLGRFTDER